VVTSLAALYTATIFRLGFVVALIVLLTLDANESVPDVRAVLLPAVIVAGVVMILSGLAHRRVHPARQDCPDEDETETGP
jgi:hypothetical protein